MRCLLDTHTLLWYFAGAAALPERVKNQIDAPEAVKFVSIASLWEIAIKVSIGKLQLHGPFDDFLELLRTYRFSILNIQEADLSVVTALSFHHRDPFDRLLIAQAINHKLVLLSKDACFKQYPLEVAW